MNDIEKSILKTICYFDLFNFPLTAWEIHKNLYQPDEPYSLAQINRALKTLQNKTLDFKEGFYFLKNRDGLVEKRKRRYLSAGEKIKRAKKYLWLISKLPFVKAIFICNDLAYQNAPRESDVDLAIIAAKGQIWSARFFSTLLMKFLNKRPTPKKKKNKICLSFYLSEDDLNLKDISIRRASGDSPDSGDIHFIYWLNQFLPIYGNTDLIEKFFNENKWTKNFLPNIFPIKTNTYWRLKSKTATPVFQSRWLGNWMETLLKKLQLKIMPKQIKQLAEENNTNVILNDKLLKFHTKDQRLAVLKRWENSTRL